MTSPVPVFFVPGATSEDQESRFEELARFARQMVPPVAERIYAIAYSHNGEKWTAVVGETSRGVSSRTSRSKGRTIERTTRLSDPATVLAIFPGNPYVVVTNHMRPRNMRSTWANPFLAGAPTSVTKFSAT